MNTKNDWKFEVVFAGSVAKRDVERNEDFYCVDEENLRFVLSDGASVSYDPATWAAMLCEKYVSDPRVDLRWIDEAVKSYSLSADRDSLPWMKQAAFDRGSFASLLGLSADLNDEKIDVTAFGDSNVLIMKDGLIVVAFPITNVDEFARAPDLLCTVASENTYLSEDVIRASTYTFDLTSIVNEDQVAILMATDALSAWVMQRDTDDRLRALFAVSSADQFAHLVHQSRGAAGLKIDDTTMITIRIRRDLPAKH